MKQFTLDIKKKIQRPVVHLDTFYGYDAMLDTGALFPVWVSEEEIYPEFHIIACELKLPCHMLMSATMFRNLIYEIDDYNHRFNVTIPDTQSTVRNLVIRDEKGNLHVSCTSGN